MRSLRVIIAAAIRGDRISKAETMLLGEQLDAWWRDKCARCRRSTPVDVLDHWNGRCDECDEIVARGEP